jgi:hypothetical protein
MAFNFVLYPLAFVSIFLHGEHMWAPKFSGLIKNLTSRICSISRLADPSVPFSVTIKYLCLATLLQRTQVSTLSVTTPLGYRFLGVVLGEKCGMMSSNSAALVNDYYR